MHRLVIFAFLGLFAASCSVEFGSGRAVPDGSIPDGAAPDSTMPDGVVPDDVAGQPDGGSITLDWIEIEGGAFQMGSDSRQSDEQPVHVVTVLGFEMTKTEITVTEYRTCVTAGACTAAGSGSDCNWDDPGYEDHPVNCVTWQQARDFCTWTGGRLPSESEWEYTARSRGQSCNFPWGDDPASCTFAVMDVGGDGCGMYRTWPVCSKPEGNSQQGLCDLAGNVWELVEDWYHDGYTSAPSDGSAWLDPPGSARVIRGGCFAYNDYDLAATERDSHDPFTPHVYVGFRCAR